MAKCPKCGEEVAVESSGWNWVSSLSSGRMVSGLSSPFRDGLFKCAACGTDSLSVRSVDILVFRFIDMFPLFVFMLSIFASIPWLNLNNYWLFLLLYPACFAGLWGFVLYKFIVDLWWKNLVQLQPQDNRDSFGRMSFICDTVIYCFLILAIGQGLKFFLKHGLSQ